MLDRTNDTSFEEFVDDENDVDTGPTVIRSHNVTDAHIIDEINDGEGEATQGPQTLEPEVEEIPQDDPKEQRRRQLNGEFLMFIIDTAMPLAIKYGTEAFNKKVEVDLMKLKLDSVEKEMLKADGEEVAELLFGKLTAMQRFFMGLGVIYTDKAQNAMKPKGL